MSAFLSDPAFGKIYRRRVHELYQGGLQIYTTLEPSLQREAQIAIANRMGGPGRPNVQHHRRAKGRDDRMDRNRRTVARPPPIDHMQR